MTASEIRKKFIAFYKARGHKEIASAPLVPENDPTTLFTSSGMQPLVPYLLGEPHPLGKRLVDSQKSFRSQDIEEIGDNRHTTFFEMLGNWSLGDYFKKEQLGWVFEFFTKELGLDPTRLYVSVFEGDERVPKDEESLLIWKELFGNVGIDAKEGERIFLYPASKNWWSRSGEPEKMPPGEPGGPDSEVFYDFGAALGLHEKSPYKNEPCHPNCDCGRFMEIGNSVFMQYQKQSDGSLKELSQKNVDFGGGLERLNAAVNNQPDVFMTDSFHSIIHLIEETSKKKYGESEEVTKAMRIIADHMKASIFLVSDGVLPSNKSQGYVLRRLLRRATVKFRKLNSSENLDTCILDIVEAIFKMYKHLYFNNINQKDIQSIISQEVINFEKTLIKGTNKINNFISEVLSELDELKETIGFIQKNRFPKNINLLMNKSEVISYLVDEQANYINLLIEIVKKYGVKDYYVNEEMSNIPQVKLNKEDNIKLNQILDYFNTHKILLNSKWTFKFVTSFGIPIEVLEDIVSNKGLGLDTSMLDNLYKEHQELSRVAAAGMFKGGLAEHSVETTKLHTATHLLHQALRTVLGDHVSQKGSNITGERLRFDFSHPDKLTQEEVKKVEALVNETIKENLPVTMEEMNKDEALSSGALGFFVEKYGDRVKVYTIGDPKGTYFSREICGGPHVGFTGALGHFTITKEESAASGVRRIYATVT